MKTKSRLSLLLVAVSLAITTACLGLATPLQDKAEITQHTRVARGDEFGISISDPTVDKVIFPGDEIPFEVTVSNNGEIPTYLVASIDIPSDFIINQGVGISEDWLPIVGVGGESAYYYGTEAGPAVFDTSSMIVEMLQLDPIIEMPTGKADNITYDIEITVWAIQKTVDNTDSSPEQLWGMKE